MDLALPLILELVALGLATGFLAGLLGIGGGSDHGALHHANPRAARGGARSWRSKMAIATSMATIIFTSVSSVRAHHKRGAVDWSIVKRLAPGIVIGSLVGSLGVFALLKGTALAIFFALGKASPNPVISRLCRGYIYAFRGSPFFIQLFMFYSLALAFNLSLWKPLGIDTFVLNPLFLGPAILCLNTTAYTAVTGRTLSSDRLTFQPDITFNLASDYVVPIGDDSLAFNVSAVGKGKRLAATLNQVTPTFLKGYTLVNGSIAYRHGPFELAAFVRNVRNKVVAVNAIDFNNFTGVVSEPRTYGLQVKFSY